MEVVKKTGGYTIKELRAICQATAPNPQMESLTGRFTRIFSIYTTKLLLHTKITPNQITALGSFIFFLGAATYFGSYWVTLLGPFLYFLSIVVDGSDGEVARFKKAFSKFGGGYAEPVSHDIQYGFFFFLISFALFSRGYSPYILVAGAMASITKLLYRSLRDRFWLVQYARTEQEKKEVQQAIDKKRHPLARTFYWLNRNIYSYPGILFPLLAATAVNRMDIFIIFYAVSHFLLFSALFLKQILFILKHG